MAALVSIPCPTFTQPHSLLFQDHTASNWFINHCVYATCRCVPAQIEGVYCLIT